MVFLDFQDLFFLLVKIVSGDDHLQCSIVITGFGFLN